MCDEGIEISEVQAGATVYPAGHPPMGPRRVLGIEIGTVEMGSFFHAIDGEEFYASQGSVLLIPPSRRATTRTSRISNTRQHWLVVDFEQLPTSFLKRVHALPQTLPLSPDMSELLVMATTLEQSRLPTRDNVLRAVALAILWRFVGEGEARRDTRGVSPHLARALDVIDTHLTEVLTTSVIAAASSISRSHLHRLFRAELGTTPMAYVWDKRIRHSLQLVEHTGLKFGLIAQQSGFRTSFHFARKVRQATGLAPRQLRRNAQAQWRASHLTAYGPVWKGG